MKGYHHGVYTTDQTKEIGAFIVVLCKTVSYLFQLADKSPIAYDN